MAALNGRSIVVGLVAFATAFFVVRNAYVAAYAGPAPQRAAAVWPGHPDVLFSQALTDIGTAAVKGEPPPQGALADIALAARLAPLSHDAFLVRGIRAQQAGDLQGAARSFIAARQRAPREAAPRYFLAELYIRTGRGADGLRELATLARLLPNGSANVAPSLAAYAKTSGDIANLKAILGENPVLEREVLVELAKDPSNADLAIRLAGGVRTPGGEAEDWVKVLLPNLVQAGQFERAYRLWAAVSEERTRGTIFNSSFQSSTAPPPFNWSYRADSTGIAESDGRGGLHVLFYGREDSILASQTLLLAPGRYRISMLVEGNPDNMVLWSLTCLPAKSGLLDLSLGESARSLTTQDFTVPAGCPAQMLELQGRAGEMPRDADITISKLKLTRTGDGD